MPGGRAKRSFCVKALAGSRCDPKQDVRGRSRPRSRGVHLAGTCLFFAGEDQLEFSGASGARICFWAWIRLLMSLYRVGMMTLWGVGPGLAGTIALWDRSSDKIESRRPGSRAARCWGAHPYRGA